MGRDDSADSDAGPPVTISGQAARQAPWCALGWELDLHADLSLCVYGMACGNWRSAVEFPAFLADLRLWKLGMVSVELADLLLDCRQSAGLELLRALPGERTEAGAAGAQL